MGMANLDTTGHKILFQILSTQNFEKQNISIEKCFSADLIS
jgi:hypothetical protein